MNEVTIQHLDQWVTVQAGRRPEAPAVVLGDRRLTYGQLESLSNRLARCLMHGGCRPGDRVALLMPKAPEAVAAIIGIYKAGAIYVPLDPSGPAKRLAAIVHSCTPRWILAAGPVAELLDELFLDERLRRAMRVGWLAPDRPQGEYFSAEFDVRDLDAYAPSPPTVLGRREDPAHILYTSGSTGTPKGVVITHANVIAFIEWAVRYFNLQPNDRLSGHPPLHFDLSFLDIFGAFAAGAELHLVPPDLNVLPNKLAEFIRASALTQWFSVPSVLNYMAKFDVVCRHDFPSLKRLLWCGEVMPTPVLIYLMQRLPHVQFTNLYGPTETTIASSYYTVPACPAHETAPIPIGRACDGEELLVLDAQLRPVPLGQIGGLYVRGAGVSPGYWNDPERTQEAFRSMPASRDPSRGPSAGPADRIYKTGDLARIGQGGLLYFLGRADTQIKSRGYRIELGEIEAALHALGILQEVAVVAVPSDGFEGVTIGCAYVLRTGAPITPAAIRQALSRYVPPYMLPARWLAFEALPKNANGKIDRRRLTEMFQVVREREAQAHR